MLHLNNLSICRKGGIGEPAVRPMERSSERDAASILDTGFVLDAEENGGSSLEGALTSDDPVATNDATASPVEAGCRSTSPVPVVTQSTVLFAGTPPYGSDDIENPDSQAATTDMDTE